LINGEKSSILQFCNKYISTPHQSTATIALDSGIALLPATRIRDTPRHHYVPFLNQFAILTAHQHNGIVA
jgi:hypothetical protein